MMSHKIRDWYGEGVTGTTWCGRYVWLSDKVEKQWSFEGGAAANTTDGEPTCSVCRRAIESDKQAAA